MNNFDQDDLDQYDELTAIAQQTLQAIAQQTLQDIANNDPTFEDFMAEEIEDLL